jgi:hypothetical protein
MVLFISCQEKISSFDFYRSWGARESFQSDPLDPGEVEAHILQGSQEEAMLNVPNSSQGSLLSVSAAAQRPILDPLYPPFSTAGCWQGLLKSSTTTGASQKPIVGLLSSSTSSDQQPEKDLALTTTVLLAKYPPEPRKKLSHVVVSHGVPGFLLELKFFLRSLLPPEQRPDKRTTAVGALPFTALDVWHLFKITPAKLLDDQERDMVKAVPASKSSTPPRYDTVIVLDGDEAESTAVQGRIVSVL